MTAATLIPSYTAGTWDIDPVHSDVSFSVRHMMVSKVRGRFGSFSGQITTGEDITGSSVTATIDATSIDTNNEQRDNHIRSADFFDVANHPTWTFASNGVRVDDDDAVPRRRAHDQGRDPAGHAVAAGRGLRPGRLRRHARGLLGHHHDQPQRLRRRHLDAARRRRRGRRRQGHDQPGDRGRPPDRLTPDTR